MLGEGRCGVRIDGEHEEWAAVYSVRSSEPSSGKALQGSALCRWQVSTPAHDQRARDGAVGEACAYWTPLECPCESQVGPFGAVRVDHDRKHQREARVSSQRSGASERLSLLRRHSEYVFN